MADDIATPSNLPVTLVDEEKLEKTLFDVIVSQRSRKEKPPRKVVCIQVDRSAWDCRLSPNPHTLVIYLKFVHDRGVALERFEECQCEDDDVHLHYETWVPGDSHYHWL